MAERIPYIETALPKPGRVTVAVLQVPNAEAESPAHSLEVGTQMRSRRGRRAVSARGHREHKRRRDQICELEADMIDAVPEGRCLDEPTQWISGQAMLLREDRVRHFDVLVLHPGVAEHHSYFVLPDQEVVSCSGNVLNR